MSHHRDIFFETIHNVTLPILEPDTRWHLTQALGLLMSDASEENFAAGWLRDWETMCPRYIVRGDCEHAETITTLVNMLGHWATYYWDDTGECYIPFMQPQED